ncbi:hypothetical protein SORBI_3003G064100 [Sorghum bicolor]|uniref:Uncharacterized protein n=1 Tax=Sorghum bicolor TaxID=4558 RepID=A0A1W0VVY4_SORBI|nr:hypothetical protein SORBI_3003G064100 [Sorghum bicolor]
MEDAGEKIDVGEKITPSISPANPQQQQRKKRKDFTPAEWRAAMVFIWAAIDDYREYAAMTEEEVEEEYRRAGKIDKYDPEMELKKRYARVAKKHPPPDGYDPKLEEYLKLIEDED